MANLEELVWNKSGTVSSSIRSWERWAVVSALGSYGLAIIVLTLAIKLVTFPLTYQQIRSTKAMRDVQPLMEEAKKRYGKDRERMTQETMKIYKENGVNPAMGCLPMLIQMPILFGLYWALYQSPARRVCQPGLPLGTQSGQARPVPVHPGGADHRDPVRRPEDDDDAEHRSAATDHEQGDVFMPLTFGFVATSVPSGLALYWVTTNLFTFFQQLFTTGWGDLKDWGN